MNNQKIEIDRNAYLTAAGLSVFASSLLLALIIVLDVRQTYFVMSHVAKEVVMANIELAKQACYEACRKVFLIQVLSLAPPTALLSAFISCLWLRSFSKKFRTPTKREIGFCLLPVPLIALMVFLWNPHEEFQLPFNTLYWRTAKAEERGRLVPWLVRSFRFEGMNKEELEASLGEPDFNDLYNGNAGYIGYKTGGLLNFHSCIFFYFDNEGKAFTCDKGERKAGRSSILDLIDD